MVSHVCRQNFREHTNVLILIVMDNGLSHCPLFFSPETMGVLILIVMDNGLSLLLLLSLTAVTVRS